jgi:hypothetical protein
MRYFEKLPEGTRPTDDVLAGLRRIERESLKNAEYNNKQGWFSEAAEWQKFADLAKRVQDRFRPER